MADRTPPRAGRSWTQSRLVALGAIVGIAAGTAIAVTVTSAADGPTEHAATPRPAPSTHRPVVVAGVQPIVPQGPPVDPRFARLARQNLQRAREEAARLAEVPLPPGTVAGAKAVGALAKHLQYANDGSAHHHIDRAHIYLVPLSLSDATAWFRANPPNGLHLFGFGGSPRKSSELDWAGPKDAAWGEAETRILMLANGRSTAVRVDGAVDWYDPTPVRVRPGGTRIRITVKAGCPARDRSVSGVSNLPSADLFETLLPNAAPTAELVCEYFGMNGRPFRLKAEKRLGAADAGSDAAGIRARPVGVSYDGPHSCFAIDGSATVQVFAYAGRPDVDIWNPQSCSGIDNGFIRAGGIG